jgi:uroporphyrinogen-III synthase
VGGLVVPAARQVRGGRWRLVCAAVKVVVTRPRAQAAELVSRLEALGHEVAVCPLIEVEPIDGPPVDVEPYDWVVVTSRNGAEELLRRARGHPQKVAAIGPGTAEVLVAGGVRPALVPRVSTQEGLLAELPRPAGRVLLAAAEGARRLLVDALGADFLPLYRTRGLRPRLPADAGLVVLASASAARALGALATDVPAVSIGPQTTAAARAAGVRVLAEARTHDLDGLVAAVEAAAV